jgi:SAM-dependent methyltransferase
MVGFPSRFDWLLKNMQCPHCGHAGFAARPGEVSCGQCEQAFDLVNGAVSFLDAGTRATFDIVDTENVSDHPYDGNALAIIERCAAAGGYVLDCGSGYKTRQFPNVIQMEIVPFPTVDVLATNQRLPLRDEAFAAVFSLDVLEHVNDPWRGAQELIRVLRPGGYVYVDIPFLQHEHGYPDHYFNATRSGLRQLFKGTEVLGHHVPASGSPMHTLHATLAAYRACLPPEHRPRLEALTVGDILAIDPTSWQTDRLVTDLPEATRWVLASTTQALAEAELRRC